MVYCIAIHTFHMQFSSFAYIIVLDFLYHQHQGLDLMAYSVSAQDHENQLPYFLAHKTHCDFFVSN